MEDKRSVSEEKVKEHTKITKEQETVDVAKEKENAEATKEQNISETIARLDETIEKMSKRLEELSSTKQKPKASNDAMAKKLVATMAAMFVLIFSLAVCTYAYFVSTVSLDDNIISTGSAGVILVNTTDPSYPTDPNDNNSYLIFPGYRVAKNVYAENVGLYPLYVRVKLVSDITLNERYANRAAEIDLSLVTYSIDLDNWTERDGYYYYNVPINSGEKTTNLLESINFSEQMGNIYKDSKIKVEITIEVVQSNNNNDSVFNADGWTSVEEGGTP